MKTERGVALVIVLLVMVALSALAMSLSLLVSTESRVTATYRDGIEVLYGADAALARVVADLGAEPDLEGVRTGLRTSSFTDGQPGLRMLPDGTFVDLHALAPDLDPRQDRPWALYGYGRLPGDSRVYAVVWVTDGGVAPTTDDGEIAENPGSSRFNLLAQAYGLAGSQRAIEATVARSHDRLIIISWREVR